MPVHVEVRELPSYTVATLGGYIGPEENVPQVSRTIGDRLLHWAQSVGLKRDADPKVKGLAMLNGDWAGYISSGAPQEKHIPLFFVQGMLIGQAPGAYRSFEGRFNDRSATDMGLAVQHTPPGSYAVARVEGPYPMERPVGSALMGEWLPSSGYKYRGGPMIELYLTTLDEVRDEKKLVTEICVPVTRS